MSWTSWTRTPSSTASRTQSAAWTTRRTRGSRTTSCRRACRCCLSSVRTPCSLWSYANGQRVKPLYQYCAWKQQLLSVKVHLWLIKPAVFLFLSCSVRVRGALRTWRSSTRSCFTSRLRLISPPQSVTKATLCRFPYDYKLLLRQISLCVEKWGSLFQADCVCTLNSVWHKSSIWTCFQGQCSWHCMKNVKKKKNVFLKKICDILKTTAS